MAASALRLKVLTYNIRAGVGMDGVNDIDRIARVIENLNPDLVALQEVDRCTERSSQSDQPGRLAEALKMHAFYAKAIDLQGGEYGNLLLSRWPLLETRRIALPELPGQEPRVVAALRPDHPSGRSFWFIGVHMEHTHQALRVRQVQRLMEAFAEEPHPMILTGDFNEEPGGEALSLLEPEWKRITGNALTWPTDQPSLCIDHLYVRPSKRWIATRHEVILEVMASDHFPVLAHLEWAE